MNRAGETIVIEPHDTVAETLQKMGRANDALLQRELDAPVRKALANLGTCVASYLYQVERHQQRKGKQ